MAHIENRDRIRDRVGRQSLRLQTCKTPDRRRHTSGRAVLWRACTVPFRCSYPAPAIIAIRQRDEKPRASSRLSSSAVGCGPPASGARASEEESCGGRAASTDQAPPRPGIPQRNQAALPVARHHRRVGQIPDALEGRKIKTVHDRPSQQFSSIASSELSLATKMRSSPPLMPTLSPAGNVTSVYSLRRSFPAGNWVLRMSGINRSGAIFPFSKLYCAMPFPVLPFCLPRGSLREAMNAYRCLPSRLKTRPEDMFAAPRRRDVRRDNRSARSSEIEHQSDCFFPEV